MEITVLPEEEHVKEDIREKEVKREGWWSKLDMRVKVIYFAIIALIFWQAKVRNYDTNKTLMFLGLVTLLMYLLTLGETRKGGYTAKEAIMLIKMRIEELKRDGDIPSNCHSYIKFVSPLRYSNMNPKDYIIHEERVYPDGAVRTIQWNVDYLIGNPTWQKPPAYVTGLERPHTKLIIPPELRMVKEEGFLRLFR